MLSAPLEFGCPPGTLAFQLVAALETLELGVLKVFCHLPDDILLLCGNLQYDVEFTANMFELLYLFQDSLTFAMFLARTSFLVCILFLVSIVSRRAVEA